MKQYEAVIKAMEENGGYATLAHLNQNVPNIDGCEWKTKTPFASIRRIVQDKRYFFKIRPGLWALNTHKGKFSPDIIPDQNQPKEKQREYSHTYYQGLLVELGNFKKYKTYVPNQDKNRLYLGEKLCDITAISEIYPFTYQHILQKAKTADVIWFNERGMPSSFFEVEHSTAMYNSLLKFVELQDFSTNFYIVADELRKREFQAKLSLDAFRPISKRVDFWNYDNLAKLHSKTSEMINIESKLNLYNDKDVRAIYGK